MAYTLDMTGGIILCCLKTFDPENTEVGGQRTTAVLDDVALSWIGHSVTSVVRVQQHHFLSLLFTFRLHLIVDNFYVMKLVFLDFLTNSCCSILYFVGRKHFAMSFSGEIGTELNVMCV